MRFFWLLASAAFVLPLPLMAVEGAPPGHREIAEMITRTNASDASTAVIHLTAKAPRQQEAGICAWPLPGSQRPAAVLIVFAVTNQPSLRPRLDATQAIALDLRPNVPPEARVVLSVGEWSLTVATDEGSEGKTPWCVNIGRAAFSGPLTPSTLSDEEYVAVAGFIESTGGAAFGATWETPNSITVHSHTYHETLPVFLWETEALAHGSVAAGVADVGFGQHWNVQAFEGLYGLLGYPPSDRRWTASTPVVLGPAGNVLERCPDPGTCPEVESLYGFSGPTDGFAVGPGDYTFFSGVNAEIRGPDLNPHEGFRAVYIDAPLPSTLCLGSCVPETG